MISSKIYSYGLFYSSERMPFVYYRSLYLSLQGFNFYNILRISAISNNILQGICKYYTMSVSANGSEYRLALLLVVLMLAHELEVVEDAECKFI
uniref:Uncharacterized protein n=1 Tax=Cucumis melo TaxID=3656 RepID=A0A9I9EKM4_CUCME